MDALCRDQLFNLLAPPFLLGLLHPSVVILRKSMHFSEQHPKPALHGIDALAKVE